MKKTKRVKLFAPNQGITRELIMTLVELMVYSKLSYPTGCRETCEVELDDKENRIETPDTIYTLDNETYVYLHLLSNKIIAGLYKELDNDENYSVLP